MKRQVENYLDRATKDDLQKAAKDGFCSAKASMRGVIYKRMSADAKTIFSREDVEKEIILFVASNRRAENEAVKSAACTIL